MNAAPTTSTEWTVLHVGRSSNNWWKVTARRGGHVLHVDKLSEAEARGFDADAAATAWAAR